MNARRSTFSFVSVLAVVVGVLFGLVPGFGVGDANAAACPNEAFRTGYSAALPDCRAYEVVSPGVQPFFETFGNVVNVSSDASVTEFGGEGEGAGQFNEARGSVVDQEKGETASRWALCAVALPSCGVDEVRLADRAPTGVGFKQTSTMPGRG
jgi:hypothetical protein